MTPEGIDLSEHRHERHSGGHRSHRRRSRRPGPFSGISKFFQRIGEFFSGSGKRKHKRSKKLPVSQRIKLRYKEFKAEFALPESYNRSGAKRPSLGQRIKSRLKEDVADLSIPKIKREKIRNEKFSDRVKYGIGNVKEDLTFKRLFPKVGKRIPLKAKIAYFRETKWQKYKVIFSRDYLVITFNSTILFLCAFYIVHFVSQLVTGIFCSFFDIQTVLYYGTTEYHFTIKSVIEGEVIMNKWTLLDIIVVFSSAPVVCLLFAIITYKFLNMKRIKFSFGKFFRKIRSVFAGKQKRQAMKLEEARTDQGKKINLSGYMRLFLIWFICHAFTYFFSGMLFSWLFFMRFGYVTGYIFDSYFFDNLAAILSLISMVLLGFLFVSLFLHTSRMYFNQLVDWTRMPFVFSQILFPAIIGLPIIVVTMLPNVVLKIAAMQVCMIILILPLMWRGQMYPEVQFDYKPRQIAIPWKWIVICLIISAILITSLKFGISIG